MHLWVPPIATRKNCGPQAAQKLSRPHYWLNGKKLLGGEDIGILQRFLAGCIFGYLRQPSEKIAALRPQKKNHHNLAYRPLLFIFIYMISILFKSDVIYIYIYIYIHLCIIYKMSIYQCLRDFVYISQPVGTDYLASLSYCIFRFL